MEMFFHFKSKSKNAYVTFNSHRLKVKNAILYYVQVTFCIHTRVWLNLIPIKTETQKSKGISNVSNYDITLNPHFAFTLQLNQDKLDPDYLNVDLVNSD